MPVWTPGSYLVREYARLIEDLVFTNPKGVILRAHKVRKNRWRVDVGDSRRIVARYRVYARKMSVNSDQLSTEIDFTSAVDLHGQFYDALMRGHATTLDDAISSIYLVDDCHANRVEE